MSDTIKVRLNGKAIPKLKVSLLGKFAVTTKDGKAPVKIPSGKTIQLLLYLALHYNRPLNKETVRAHVWPEFNKTRSLTNYYVLMARLEASFRKFYNIPPAKKGHRDAFNYIQSHYDMLGLNLDLIDLDIQHFDVLITTITDLDEVTKSLEVKVAAAKALSRLYQGDILGGYSSDQVICQFIQKYRTNFCDCMLAVANECKEAKRLPEALTFLRRASEVDPVRDDVFLALMQTQVAAGQKGRALQTYHDCCRYIREELGQTPHPDVEQYFLSLL